MNTEPPANHHHPSGLRAVSLLLLASLVVVSLLFAAAPGLVGAGSASSPAVGVGTPLAPTTTFPTPIQHVFTIIMENQGVGAIYGKLPFETQLAKNYSWGGDPSISSPATGYYAVCHPSAPNYLALTSGTPLQCGSDAYNTYSVNNIANLMQGANVSWNAYMESATKNCQTTGTGAYAVRHDPFPYYTDIASVCGQHVLAINDLLTGFPYATVPAAYTWISPNITNDAHSSSAAFGDAWLSKFVPKLMAEPWFASSVIFIVWDEATGTGSSTGYGGLSGGPVYFVAVSPYTHRGGAYGSDSSHYNLLSTDEWLLGLGSTGHNDGTTQFPAMKGLFNFTSTAPPPTTKYTVSGAVTNGSGAPLANATVAISNGPNSSARLSDANGSFSFTVPNGSYQLTATLSGYAASSANVSVSGQNVTGVSLVLHPTPPPPVGTYSVTGAVTDSTTGTPLSGATVTANSTGAPTATTTTVNGTYFLDLPNGSYVLTATMSGYVSASESLTVAGAPIAQFNLSLAPVVVTPATYAVEGFVLVYPSGTVLAGAVVYANTSASSEAIVDAPNGTYSFSLTNGTYSITAVAPGNQPLTDQVIVNGTAIPDLNVTLLPSNLPAFGTDGGVFNNSDSTPVTNATLVISNGSLSQHILTNASGGFSTSLPNGTYNVTVLAGGYQSANTTVSVSGSAGHELNITLVPIHAVPRLGHAPRVPLEYYGFAAAGVLVSCATGWVLGRSVRRAGPRRQRVLRHLWRRRR